MNVIKLGHGAPPPVDGYNPPPSFDVNLQGIPVADTEEALSDADRLAEQAAQAEQPLALVPAHLGITAAEHADVVYPPVKAR